MKLLMATILLMGAMNSFAGTCVADVKGACKDEAECKAEVGKGKEIIFSADTKICSIKTEASSLPDCKFVYDANGEKAPVGTDGKPGTKPGSDGKNQ